MIEDKLTREHAVYDHAREGLPGMWSIAGGKLASFRLMSEEAADAVCAFLGVARGSATATTPLPGSEEEIDVPSMSVHWSVEPAVLRRMCARHGSRVREILVGMLRVPGSRGTACACEPVTEAEMVYAITQEKVRTLPDLMRRTRFGTGPCGGARCALRAAAILGRHLGWSGAAIREAAREFLDRQYRARRAAIGGAQARQEVLTAMHFR
jgi:glycerol-3-phosphate dehydrogenase